MSSTPVVPSLRWLAGLLLLALACSHDAPRDNPLDPQLTPPVELQVALEDTAGTATLTWSRYEGKAKFGAYWVLRKVPGLEAVDTLASIGDMLQTSWVDTSLSQHTLYDYRVSAVNTEEFEATSEAQTVGPMQLPPVEIVRAEFDSRIASATLTWTAYRGPGFRAYQVRRRTEELAPSVMAELGDSTITSWTDEGLVGAIEYLYQVVVLTQTGMEVASQEITGGIHQLVATWPLNVAISSTGLSLEAVRLYIDPDGRIAALVAGERSVRTCYYDRDDGQVAEQVHLAYNERRGGGLVGCHNTVARAVDPEQQAFLSMATFERGSQFGVNALIPVDTDGMPLVQGSEPFADLFTPVLGSAEATVEGTISLNATGPAHFDNVAVLVDGQPVFTEDFATFPGHSQFDVEDRRVQGWDVVGTGGGENGWLWLGNDDMTTTGTARRADPAWQSFRLEADVANSSSEYGILIGGDTHSRFGLYLDGARQQASLSWSYTAPPGIDLGSRQESFAVPLEIMPGMRYRLGLEMAGGHVRAVVQYPQLHWSETGTEQVVHSSLASIGNSLALTFDDQPYTVTQNGVASRL